MKPPRQVRAEALLERYQQKARCPIVLEFAGVPKAGKTSTISQVHSFLKRCGFRVEVVVERASVCPIRDKKLANFNVWTACTTLAQILEKAQEPPRPDDPDVLILDRGLFDAICWLTVMEKLARIRPKDREAIERFLQLDEWRRRITGVILMTVSPEHAMLRERGHLPVETTGSIMNPEVLEQMLTTTKETAKRLEKSFRVVQVDTSTGGTNDNAQRTAERVADLVLDLIEQQLDEHVLHLPKASVRALFSGRTALSPRDGQAVLEAFRQRGSFAPREQVEADLNLVQALPVVVVRNGSGHVLRLRRKEASKEHALDEQLVIWAGGHVRREDADVGDAVIQGALREVREELRLSLQAEDLVFLGSVYADPGAKKIAQHVALVFEWRAPSDDVAIALSSAEFHERRGNSLSGKFVDPRELVSDVETNRAETWTAEILRELLPFDKPQISPRLF